MKLVATGLSDVGLVREGNEDKYLHDDRLGIFAVADGMGGHEAGEVASAVAIEALRAAVASGALITEAVIQANTAVMETADANPGMRGMGTTLTAAIEVEGGLRIGHVGDSRAYVLRAGILARVTEDHSLVEELVRCGQITLEQAAIHPQRSVITRALGIDRIVEVDDISLELTDGDRVLVCSDGLSGMVHETEISAIMRRAADTEATARALIDAANAGGGEDNITVVVIDVIGEEGDPEPSPLPEIGVGLIALRATESSSKVPRRINISPRVIWAAVPVIAVIALGALALWPQTKPPQETPVRQVTPTTMPVTVAGGNGAGSGPKKLNNPVGIAIDGDGNLYITDTGNNRVQKWGLGATSGTTVAGGNGAGPGPKQLNNPVGVAIDADGNLYIIDAYNHRVQKWGPGATSGTTVAGGNGAGSKPNQLADPQGIALDADGNLYITDTANDRVQMWRPGATSGTTVAGSKGTGSGPKQLYYPQSIAVDTGGNLYIADTANHRIQKWGLP